MPRVAAVALLFVVHRCYGLQTTTRLRAIVRYDGTGFHGVQKNQRTDDGSELRTVLSVLEQSLWPALDQQVTFRVAGRTDAGVSALGQVVSFDLASGIEGDGDVDDEELIQVNGAAVCVSGLAGVLNSYLPSDLQIVEIATVPSSFDAVRDCKWKRYRYRLPSCPPESDGSGDEDEQRQRRRSLSLRKRSGLLRTTEPRHRQHRRRYPEGRNCSTACRWRRGHPRATYCSFPHCSPSS